MSLAEQGDICKEYLPNKSPDSTRTYRIIIHLEESVIIY